eukprot:scaffold7554_cov163-Isochrysis_galbana.AAC.1
MCPPTSVTPAPSTCSARPQATMLKLAYPNIECAGPALSQPYFWAQAGSTKNWDHITQQIGMFCFSGMTPDQVCGGGRAGGLGGVRVIERD